MKTPEDIINDSMVLSAKDRVYIIEKLLESLDIPDKDPKILCPGTTRK